VEIVIEDGIIYAGLILMEGKAGTFIDCIIHGKMIQNGRQWQSELMADGEQITNKKMQKRDNESRARRMQKQKRSGKS